MKSCAHCMLTTTLSTPTNLASVELRVLIFCLCDVSMTNPFPMDIVPPVWLFVMDGKQCVYMPIDEAKVIYFQYEGEGRILLEVL